MINTIVNYLIKTTIEETTEGNWIFEIKNLEKMFNFTFTNEDIRNIIDELLRNEKVADVQIYNNTIDILIYYKYIE